MVRVFLGVPVRAGPDTAAVAGRLVMRWPAGVGLVGVWVVRVRTVFELWIVVASISVMM